MKNNCFICNLDRSELQKKGVKFNNHINTEHNKWYYCYFIIKLLNKDPDEYDGNESYIMKKFNDEDFSWIPIGRAKVLTNKEGEKDNSNDSERIDRLEEKINKILYSMDLKEKNGN